VWNAAGDFATDWRRSLPANSITSPEVGHRGDHSDARKSKSDAPDNTGRMVDKRGSGGHACPRSFPAASTVGGRRNVAPATAGVAARFLCNVSHSPNTTAVGLGTEGAGFTAPRASSDAPQPARHVA